MHFGLNNGFKKTFYYINKHFVVGNGFNRWISKLTDKLNYPDKLFNSLISGLLAASQTSFTRSKLGNMLFDKSHANIWIDNIVEDRILQEFQGLLKSLGQRETPKSL